MMYYGYLKMLPAAVLVLSLALAGRTVHGGGFKVQDQSTRAMGMIDAFVAGADDASAIYYNPAGLTRLTGPQVIGNFYLAHAEAKYEGSGGVDRSDGRIYFIPNFYLGYPISDEGRWVAGLGIYSPYGLGSKWSETSPVRYHTTLSEIMLVNINPSLALQVTDRLALGAGVNYYEARVKMRNMINNPFNLPDGKQTVDVDGSGWGYNFGLLYEATDTIDLGFTYRSPTTLDLTGDLRLEGVPEFSSFFPLRYRMINVESNISTELELPTLIAGGISWQAAPEWRFELAAEWQEWSRRDVQVFKVDGASPYLEGGEVRERVDWRDSWVLMLGAEYEMNELWTLRGGYAFNESPVPAETADPSLPPGDTHAASLGLGYQYSPRLALDIAGVVSYQEKSTIKGDGAPPHSRYKAWGGYLSLGITWDF